MGMCGYGATYGGAKEPTDFGSGGSDSNGGGKIYIMATLEVIIDRTIAETGDDSIETMLCLCFRWKIYIESVTVIGTGYITATGEGLPQCISAKNIASGARGHIKIYHNTLSQRLP